MSRGVRDLRELICVSRLTLRESDEEEHYVSEDEVSLERDTSHTGVAQATPSDCSSASEDISTADSGIVTNGNSPSGNAESPRPTSGEQKRLPKPPNTDKPTSARKRRRRRKHVTAAQKPSTDITHVLSTEETLLPTKCPLGPITDNTVNYDDILTYLDVNLIAEWLQTSNQHIAEMSAWCSQGDQFVTFANFWLLDFPDTQKFEMFEMEYHILLDHLRVAFRSGLDDGRVHQKDLSALLAALFREYPSKLMSSKGAHLFLDYLDVLTSQRTAAYRRLLSDVRCSTRVKQYAQWLLAVRSFSLVSVWSAVVRFYRRVHDDGTRLSNKGHRSSQGHISSHSQGASSHECKSTSLQRTFSAARRGYVNVVHYMLTTGRVSLTAEDAQGRSLVFTAVIHEQQRLLKYLLHNCRSPELVNKPAANGNTPLHAAANQNAEAAVRVLLTSQGVVVDPVNPQSEGATPLLLAAMHGHTGVVRALLDAGADVTAKMGSCTALDLAKDFDHADTKELLEGKNTDQVVESSAT